MSGRARLTLFAALATLLTAWSLTPLVDTQGWLLQAALLLAVQSGVGAGARRVPLARSLTVAAQLLVSLLMLALLFGGKAPSSGSGSGPLAYLVTDFGALFGQGVQDVGEFAVPVPLTDGIKLLLVSGVLLIGLMVDMLAVTVRTAAAAGLPLLALYSVAAGLSGGGDASWISFLLAGCGYLLMLLAEGRDRLAQWGRVFGAAPAGAGQASAATGIGGAGARPTAPVRTGRRIGAVALGLALVVPAVLPGLGGGLLGAQGAGPGEGSGVGGTISAVNPLVSLQSSLNAQDNRVVLKYRTDSPQPEQYLRILALDEFNGVKWEASGRELTDVPARLPNPPGLSEQVRVASTEVRTSVSAADSYTQRYLPMPYPATGVDIGGKWRFEPAGRTLVGDQLAKEKFQNVQGAMYTVRSLLLKPTPQQLQHAPSPNPEIQAEYTKLPDTLPPVVAETARQVTQGAKDDYTRAVKLQDFFAVNGGFRYNTKTASGTGPQAVAKFLADKEGFCIHFAFSMAAMSRSLGIPARVAVGFAPGEKQSDGSVNVSMRDAHAWPELYFEGVGWTRFEPTPRSGITVPDYSRPQAPVAQPSAPTTLPSQGATAPSAAPSKSDDCPPDMKKLGECGHPVAKPNASGGGGPSVTAVLGWAAGALVLLGLPLLPLLWRTRVQARRLGTGEVLTAWRELGDAAWDVGVTPDEALSPRRAADRVVELGRLDPQAAAAVHRVAGAVERVLYAPPGAEPSYEGLADDVLLARAGLLAPLGRRSRLRALLAPRSAARVGWAVSRRCSALTERAGALLGRVGALLGRIRVPLRGRG